MLIPLILDRVCIEPKSTDCILEFRVCDANCLCLTTNPLLITRFTGKQLKNLTTFRVVGESRYTVNRRFILQVSRPGPSPAMDHAWDDQVSVEGMSECMHYAGDRPEGGETVDLVHMRSSIELQSRISSMCMQGLQ